MRFNWIKGHAGHIENERCDELANLALNGDNLLNDNNYKPEEKVIPRVENEGDTCRKCGETVVKKQTKKKPIKARYRDWETVSQSR